MSKKKQVQTDIQFELSRMMVPRDFLFYFEIFEVKELPQNGRLFYTKRKI